MSTEWWAKRLAQQEQKPVVIESRPAVPSYQLPPEARPKPHLSLPPDGNISAMDAASMWQGDEGVKNMQNCPNCHQATLYQDRHVTAGPGGMVQAKPKCFSCGWPMLQRGSA